MELLHRIGFKTKKGAKAAVKKGKELVKPSKTRGQIQAELETELDLLEEEFNSQIERQFQILGEKGLTKNGQESAESTIELCLGGLNLVKLAREDLRKVSTNAMLASSMKGLGRTMKTMNRMSGMAPEIKTKYLNRQIEKMNELSSKNKQTPELKKVLGGASMEGMDKNWHENVQAVIAHKLSINDFMVKCGEVQTPYEKVYRGSAAYEDEDGFYERMHKLDEAGFNPMFSDVESSADNIDKAADILDDLAAFDADIDSIF